MDRRVTVCVQKILGGSDENKAKQKPEGSEGGQNDVEGGKKQESDHADRGARSRKIGANIRESGALHLIPIPATHFLWRETQTPVEPVVWPKPIQKRQQHKYLPSARMGPD
ncbi:MAG: hypothetical protein OWQ56_01010 [Acidithiobacillus caldus]|nr:hypothetical protein [Acidithiobacillus caldus]